MASCLYCFNKKWTISEFKWWRKTIKNSQLLWKGSFGGFFFSSSSLFPKSNCPSGRYSLSRESGLGWAQQGDGEQHGQCVLWRTRLNMLLWTSFYPGWVSEQKEQWSPRIVVPVESRHCNTLFTWKDRGQCVGQGQETVSSEVFEGKWKVSEI